MQGLREHVSPGGLCSAASSSVSPLSLGSFRSERGVVAERGTVWFEIAQGSIFLCHSVLKEADSPKVPGSVSAAGFAPHSRRGLFCSPCGASWLTGAH